ncbi:MAG: FlgT C-terminal domain-containing protein [Gemmatimonadota bacterium]
MSESIAGKVAAIIDDTTLVLNVGSREGVRQGMVFAVVSAHQAIADPDTGESLGDWEAVKARVVVSHVQERMCTVRSPLQEEVDASGTLSTLMVRHSFGLYGSRREERQSLEVRAGSMAGRPKVQPIQVGDLARSVSVEVAARATPPAAAVPDLPSRAYGGAAGTPPPGDPEAGGHA